MWTRKENQVYEWQLQSQNKSTTFSEFLILVPCLSSTMKNGWLTEREAQLQEVIITLSSASNLYAI